MPGDNIYPDLSNDQFDIQYARLLGLSSDLRASFGVVEEITGSSSPPPIFPPIETPSDVDTYPDTGTGRFGVATEDDTAGENRSFDLAGAYSFALTQLGNNQFLVDPTNGLYQLGAVPIPGSDSGLSYTYLEIDDTTNKITLQAAEGIVLPGYGYGNHSGTETFFLAVDAGGNLIEVSAAAGYTDLTQFVDQNPWKVFYSDGNGDVQELSIGASGDVLTSNGASSVPSWETPATTSITADNGLIMSTATNVQLFGPVGTPATLLDSRYLTAGAFTLNITANSLAGASALNITSTSTAAASSLQKGINVAFTGANGTSGQTTRAIHATNFHTGTSSTNIAFHAEAGSGTNNYGVSATAGGSNTAVGVFGETTGAGGIGVYGFSNVGSGSRGIRGFGQSGSIPLEGLRTESSTNTALDVLYVSRSTTTSAGAASGIGSVLAFQVSTDSVGSTLRRSNEIKSILTTTTDGSRTSQLIFTGVLAGTTGDLFKMNADKSVQLTPITATAASAITPAEGMLVFVDSTNGTFAAIGLHVYENGAWAKT